MGYLAVSRYCSGMVLAGSDLTTIPEPAGKAQEARGRLLTSARQCQSLLSDRPAAFVGPSMSGGQTASMMEGVLWYRAAAAPVRRAARGMLQGLAGQGVWC
jgi:hypothetical protein